MSEHSHSTHSKKLRKGLAFYGPLEFAVHHEHLKKEEFELFSIPQSKRDEYWMYEAFKESLKASGLTSPNPAVGCILVDRNGKEIARGATQPFPGLHAERVAFSQIQNPHQLDQATAYITLEPCTHQGNQPPCIDLILNSPIQRVVISRSDPDPRVSGQGIQKLIQAGKQVEIGLFHSEITAWNFGFFGELALKRPIFTLKWAQTLDGQLADDSDSSQWISGPVSRAYTHWMRQRHDGTLVGAQTLIHDLPSLTVRDCQHKSQHQPTPIIFDPHGRLLTLEDQLREKCLKNLITLDRKVIYITHENSAQLFKKLVSFKDSPVLTLALPTQSSDSKQLIPTLVHSLHSQEICEFLGKRLQSILVEGGAKTLKAWIEAGYADSLHIFIAPLITGGRKHRIFLDRSLTQAASFETLGVQHLGQDTLIEMVSKELYQKLFHRPSDPNLGVIKL